MHISRSGSGNKTGGKRFLILFGGLFFTVGLLFFYFFTIRPLQKCHAAKSWQTASATVLSSEVKSHRDSDGDTTYSIYIRYKYQFNNTPYTNDRYSFLEGSSSGYDSKAKIVHSHPAGKKITIYVNPENPSDSVINRSMKWILIIGLFPLVFVVVGAAIMIGGFRSGKFRKLDQKQAGEHVVTLKGRSPIGKLIGITLFALIWNGVVVFLFISGAPLLFKGIFGFFGVALIGGLIHSLLACFNPRPTVQITPGNLHPGSNGALRWSMTGRSDRIQSLEITLRCLHVTTETRRSGGETKTSVQYTPIYTDELFRSENRSQISMNSIGLRIPEDQPASRRGNTNGIQWELIVKGDIPRWPDITEKFKFLVYPSINDYESSL